MSNSLPNKVDPALAKAGIAPMPHYIKIRLFVPQHDNDGKLIDAASLEFFEGVITAIAGGWNTPGISTILSTHHDLSRGSFTYPDGRVNLDLNRVYEVAVPGPEQVQQLRRVLHAFGRLAGQHSVYFEVDPNIEIHIEEVASLPPVPVNNDNEQVAANINGHIQP